MKRPTSLLLTLAFLLFASPAANAQLFRAYLASYGSDSNPCVLSAPCRLVPAALNAVASGGEIWMLDSANYNAGTVDINKSVSILAITGAVGSIVAVAGTPAVSIHTSNVVVTLRNIVIANNAANPGTKGIYMTNGKSLTLERCVFQGLSQQALQAGGNPLAVYVKDTELRNGGDFAIEADEYAFVDIVHTRMTENNAGGVVARSAASSAMAAVNITDSEISGPANSDAYGLVAYTPLAGASSRISATRVSISNVSVGLATTGPGSSMIDIGSSMLARNSSNFGVGSGTIRSLGNNQFSDPTGADSGSLTALTPR